VPLAHWRAGDALTELGVAELRFTYDEAAALLAAILQQALPGATVAALVERTEGWAAGLQLAARGARQRRCRRLSAKLRRRPPRPPGVSRAAGVSRLAR
jgi:ATP/maltotriose-dependent transcriptional regulator MalT